MKLEDDLQNVTIKMYNSSWIRIKSYKKIYLELTMNSPNSSYPTTTKKHFAYNKKNSMINRFKTVTKRYSTMRSK